MSTPQRSTSLRLLIGLLIVSGWGFALWRETRPREVTGPPPIVLPEPAMPRIFREWLAEAKVEGASVGFCLLDESGATLFASPLAETALSPASSLKVVTTGAALALLGPEFRFETALAATAPLSAEGAVEGDLILVGGGDPTLAQEDLAKLAKAAIASGLKSVAGRLIVDASIFPSNPVSDHWVWGDLGNGYGAGAFGVNLDHNRVEIRFEPGANPGDPATLAGHSAVARDTRWVNEVTTGPAGSGDQVVGYSEPYGRVITLRGTVPAGESGFTISGAIPDPLALAAELLRAQLETAGVKFADRPGPFAATGTRTILSRHQSAPLPEIIDHLHRVSDNLEAQCLFLTLGRWGKGAPATVVRQHWEKAGVTFVGLRLLDGSGLARANMIRPLDLARVNFTARRSAVGERYFESLSTYLNGHVRGKIGGMSGVKTQVGFLRTASGRELSFALMGNGLLAGREFWTRLEELLEAVRTADR